MSLLILFGQGVETGAEPVFTATATNLQIVRPSLLLTAGAALQVPFLINEAGVILTMEGDMPLISEGQTAVYKIVKPSLILREVH